VVIPECGLYYSVRRVYNRPYMPVIVNFVYMWDYIV
jgi:hypothetical protein